MLSNCVLYDDHRTYSIIIFLNWLSFIFIAWLQNTSDCCSCNLSNGFYYYTNELKERAKKLWHVFHIDSNVTFSDILFKKYVKFSEFYTLFAWDLVSATKVGGVND